MEIVFGEVFLVGFNQELGFRFPHPLHSFGSEEEFKQGA